MKIRIGLSGLIALVAVFICLLVSPPVLAHVEQSNNGISAEMHLPPEDEAIAGRAQRIQFIFEDEPSAFSLQDCDCSLKIVPPDGMVTKISTQPDSSFSNQLTSQTTFVSAGDYTLTLTGYTTAEHTTQFNLVYRLHVKPAPRIVSASARRFAYILVGLCAALAAGVLAYYYRPRAHHDVD